MFSSSFDKVVSATAPDSLATFPPRATLPAPASTLCCLSFTDRFLSHYPIAHNPATGDEHVDVRLASHVGTGGIAMSAGDLESIMQSAAELGGRLAAALAGTARSQNRGTVTTSVSDLLTKVRGIFGNRLTCVGCEIRVSRNFKAERDETLLLRQIHALKNAALDACNGEKWCIVVSSGGESLVVCAIPLPPVEDGGACGCDFFVFDPAPRPEMKLRGSYIVKFTTVRGLQLHLLSALGEIWREGGDLSKEDGVGKGFVGLSVVMAAQAGKPDPDESEARSLLEESVTRLRKAEKAAAIKIKRDEVEALRRALAGSEKNNPTTVAPTTGGELAPTGSNSRPQGLGSDAACAGSNVSSNGGSLNLSSNDGSKFRRQETHIESVEIRDRNLRGKDADGDNIESPVLEADIVATNSAPGTARVSSDSAVFDDRLNGGQAMSDNLSLPSSCISPVSRLPLQSPVVDFSPPLSETRPEREGRRRWFEDDRKDSIDRRGSREPGVASKTAIGEASATHPDGEREEAILTCEGETTLRTGLAGSEDRRGGANNSICPPNQADKPAISGESLHRALLRSVEGEGLVEYSKRAYNVYRTYGVIQDGVLGDERAPGTVRGTARGTARGLSFSSDLLDFRPTISSPRLQAEQTTSPAVSSHICSGGIKRAGHVNKRTVEKEGTCTANVGVRELVQPFSPLVSPHTLCPADEYLSHGDGSIPPPQASTGEVDLRVIDLCDAEDTVAHKPQEEKLSPQGFRSRLRAPRAGRALALASANAKGNAFRRRDKSTPFIGDFPSNALAPPPPIMVQSVHRKEAWKEKECVEEPPRNEDERRQEEPEFLFSEASSGETDIDSNESGTVGYGAAIHSAKDFGEGSYRVERPPSKREIREGRKSNTSAAIYSDHELPRTEFPRTGVDDKSSHHCADAANSGRSVYSQPELNEERSYTEISTSQPTGRNVDSGARVPIAAATLAHSPRLKSVRPLEESNRCEQRVSRSQVSRVERVTCDQTRALAEPVDPLSKDGSRGGLYLDENGRTEDAEPMGDSRSGRLIKGVVDGASKTRDEEAFVWFGQPDTSPTRQGNESRHSQDVASAGVIEQAGRSSPQQRHLSKARLLLQMEVRRQREIIEHAFQQREEEGKLRRARLGAEVLKRVRALRANCNPSPKASVPSSYPRTRSPSRELKPLTHADEVECALGEFHGVADNKCEPEQFLGKTHGVAGNNVLEEQGNAHGVAENVRHAELLLGGTDGETVNAREPEYLPRKAQNAAEDARLDHPERTIKAWGFGPVKYPATVVKETSFQSAPDMDASVEASSRGEVVAPVPTRPTELLPRSAVDNPWRQAGRQAQQEGLAAARAPTPPSISFDVAVDDFSGGQAGLSGRASEEQAKRQERYKALRARKLAEAEERRRDQKARQAAARESQRRNAAATAAAATENADERRIQDAKQEARRQSSMKQETPASDVISTSVEDPPRVPQTRPRLSSARKADRDNSNHKDRGPADTNSYEGAWRGGVGARVPTSGPARIASPAVRSFSQRSNRKLVRNAINFLCLAGGHLQEKKTRALEALDAHPAANFVVLLTHTKLLAFKGLYACRPEEDDTAERVFGLGPPQVDAAMISGFYKYNSAAREFREVHSKTLGKTTDAVSVEPARLRRTKGLAAHPAP